MIRGMYTVSSALETATLNQGIIAENLANVNSPGYRRQGLLFESVRQSASGDATVGATTGEPRGSNAFTSFEPGPLQQTGNPLDLALSGNLFFVLDGPSGPLYTRNGSFQLGAQGQLQSRNGLPVRSVGGRISIPASASRIDVTGDGVVKADDVEIGRLQLAEFSDTRVLQRAGTSLFQGPSGRQPETGTYRVEQGFRESSNVQVVNEMVAMITGMRHYEAAQRAMHALGEAIGMNTKPQS